ncbi:hypothetical protein FJY63_06270 [Candidatus Sumerlaeota bacterium]|nr:hypothetical protein [Candidatus Sumerlaeota bacterium]
MTSSKVTNILLAVIAACLVVIALRPAVVRPVAAQVLGSAGNDVQRLSSITATSKELQQQVDAIKAVATSIDSLARNTGEIAKSLDGMTAAVRELGLRLAESRAGAVVAPSSVAPSPR